MHRTPNRPDARPAAVLTASLVLALTGFAAPAFAADTPLRSGSDCGYDNKHSDNRNPSPNHCQDSRGGISYELQSRTLETTFTVVPGTPHNGSLACDPGWLIDSGGVALSSTSLFLQKSIKGVSESWETTVVNNDTASHTYDLAIVCKRLVAIQH
ncbi:hypothetical protein [Streptomyces sp. NPDC057939]|uniref:hypothetical protein n=1 Tax=Streptomyces sp. NPDC057939 TaxID=3346284 RepID=UPI0036EA21DD